MGLYSKHNGTIKNDYYEYFKKISHRGPNNSIYTKIKNVYIGFHRLAIQETALDGNQPFEYKNSLITCNGEIYNYKDLINKYKLNISNNSDCLTILELYKSLSFEDFLNVLKNELIAEFSFIIYDFDENNVLTKIIASRDVVGVRPLFYGNDTDNNIIFSSEIKGIPNDINIMEFPCGHLYINDLLNNTITLTDFRYIYDIKEKEENLNNIKNTLIDAVKNRMICDNNIEIAYLLSGGLDSSLICSIASKLSKNKIKTFSIGFEGFTDLPYAKKVADFIGSDHTEIIITEKEALDVIDDVIYCLETYDITTIRASVPNYLLAKYIRNNTNISVCLSGEGSDELLSGYIFNYNAPNDIELHNCSINYVKNIHLYDGRRCDRCLSYFGLEARVPFLDLNFIKAVWETPALLRMPTKNRIEKFILREAFNDNTYLPNECLFRKKEAFSDGISSKNKSWFKIIESNIKCIKRDDSPTIESSYYKNKFIEFFGENRLNIIPNYWQPAFQNNNIYIDPSARILNVYND